MRRVLISVGCDAYEFMGVLYGAVNDARRMVAALADNENNCYNQSDVLLIESPTIYELQSKISKLDLASDSIDTITFFFAGHGCVKSGSFWMCVADTNGSKLATTAYSLSSLLLLIQEVRPKHANIIIDACESGGVLSDIKSALRSNDLGDADTTGISLLAACAKNQYANESSGEGVCTSAIIDCIGGSIPIQDISPSLDLAEIAKAVLGSNMAEQNPVFWGLNLSGGADFCANPKYNGSGSLRKQMMGQSTEAWSSRSKDRLWKIYLDLDEDWRQAEFFQLLAEFLERKDIDTTAKLAMLMQISSAFSLRARESPDAVRSMEVCAAGICSLLPLCETDAVRSYVKGQIRSLRKEIYSFVSFVVEQIGRDKFFLLGDASAVELFYLPLRISKLFGWIGFAFLADDEIEGSFLDDTKRFCSLVKENYVLSCTAVSDHQAAPYVIMIAGFITAGLVEEAESLASLMFCSLCDQKGSVASYFARASEILPYLLMRASGDYQDSDGIVARPSELAMASLLSSGIVGLGDVFDSSMIDLDRISINAFLPDRYTDFYEPIISEGENYTFRVGFDFWTTSELSDHFSRVKKPVRPTGEIDCLVMLCSLLKSDRICWYLLDSVSFGPSVVNDGL